MNIKHIHIGCWYCVNGKPGKAISINTNIKNGVKLDGIHSCPADKVKQIPITKAFLDKNDIRENENINEEGVHYRETSSIWLVTNECSRVFDINNDPDAMICTRKIDYIDQLQQVLTIAGFEKLADDLKVIE